MNLQKTLENIGLNAKEAKIYLVNLEMGQDTAYNIANACKLKRSTVYFVLNQLQEKGLVSIKKTKKATFFTAVSPHKFSKYLQRRQLLFEKVYPLLEEKYEQQPHKPLIKVFEGKEGVLQIYKEANEYLKKAKEVLYFGSTLHWDREGYQDILNEWTKALKNKKFKVRELLSGTETGKMSGRNYEKMVRANQNPNHKIRFLPDDLRFHENDNMIYGNKLTIFSIGKNTFVTVIESKNIADSYRSLFESAWKNARLP